MGNIANETLMLRTLWGTAFLRYVLKESALFWEIKGILITEEAKDTSNTIYNIKQLDDTMFYKNWNTHSIHALNYEIGILQYNRHIKESNVCDFLCQEDFFPLVMTDGIVPDFLRSEEFIIPLKIKENCLCEFLHDYRCFKTFVIENLEYIIREINLFKTEMAYYTNNVPSEIIPLYRSLIAVGKIWKLFERNQNIREEICNLNYHRYITYISKLLDNAERFENDYDVREAVKSVVISYVEKNSVLIIDTTQITNKILDKIIQKCVILQDYRFYYFPEKFFKVICNPLLECVSFLHLKNEMHKNGMLICDDSKHKNFTVKKFFYNNESNEEIRMRFLKFPKEVFENDEALPLDLIVNTKSKTNIVKPFRKAGGKAVCILESES